VIAAASERASAEKKQAESIVTQVTGVAESAVLVPVGVALEVRDRVAGVIQPWTTRPSAERELNRVRRDVRRYERRGTVARNRVVRELRKRRNSATRVVRRRRNEAARFLRLRRNGAERSLKQNGRHAQARADRLRSDLQQQTKQARDRVQQFV
jgi:hypothetical protein